MQRFQIADCTEKIRGKFELISLAAQRVREINNGKPITINREKHKNTVIALKEVEDNKVCISKLRKGLINNLQSYEEEFYCKDDILEDEKNIDEEISIIGV